MVLTRRARSSEQKSERRDDILAAAEALLRERSYYGINIADVANRAGMAKGTVFLYFKTKEEVFFHIAAREFVHWFDAMDIAFAEACASGKKTPETAVMNSLRLILEQNPLLPQLSAILHVILEQNIGYQEARDFKKNLFSRLGRTGALLEKCLLYLRPGQGVKLLLWVYGLIIGFTHMANPAPVMQKIYRKEAELRQMQIDFNENLFSAMGAILDGWKMQHRGRSQR